jgi:hypothetical protein
MHAAAFHRLRSAGPGLPCRSHGWPAPLVTRRSGQRVSGDPGETAANDVRHPRSILLPHLLHALDELGRVLLTGNREVSARIREKPLRVPRQVLPEPVPVATTTQVHPQPQRGQDVRRFLLEVKAAHRRIYPVNVTLSLLHQLVPGPAHRTSM